MANSRSCGWPVVQAGSRASQTAESVLFTTSGPAPRMPASVSVLLSQQAL